jgi:hypothetical protein
MYNPSANNNSGQILAAGMNDMAGQYATDLLRAQEIEAKRRAAAGQIQGLLASNPQLGQKADPSLLAKMTSGKANYKDTLELLGTLQTVRQQEEDALNQKMKQVQMQQLMAHGQMLEQQVADYKSKAEADRLNREAMKKAAPYIAGETQADFGARGGYVMANPAPMAEQNPQRALQVAAQAGMDPRELGSLAESMARVAPKPVQPKPSSGGFSQVQVPGLGTMVIDNVTGKPVGSGDIIKRDPKTPLKPTEADVAFETNIDEGLSKIAEYRSTVEKFGNWESARLGNPKAAAALDQIPYQLAIMHAKIADPSSVAREGEVAAAQKYMLPSGFWTSNAQTLAALDGLENTFKGYASARKKARGEPASAGAAPAATAAPASKGAGVRECADANEVQAAVDRGEVAPGAYVRVGGRLVQVRS